MEGGVILREGNQYAEEGGVCCEEQSSSTLSWHWLGLTTKQGKHYAQLLLNLETETTYKMNLKNVIRHKEMF